MNPIRKLAQQTVIYGLSSVVSRFLNYLLVFIYTRVYKPEVYGIVTELYAYLTFLIIILTYGMETGFFKFTQSEKDKESVYSTSLITLFTSSTFFIFLVLLFSRNIASYMGYANNPEYIIWFGWILGLDAIMAIPFARLRSDNRPIKFAFYKLLNVIVNIASNVFFIIICPILKSRYNPEFLKYLYDPSIGVGYVFISNLIASIFTLSLFIPEFFKVQFNFNFKLLKNLLFYSFPLLIAGLAGSINETLDRVLLKHLLPSHVNAMQELGIYGANIKLAVVMILFIQMYRFAAEPFFFNYDKEKDSKKVFADVTKYFIIFVLFIFLLIMAYIDIFKYFIGSEYHIGLKIVPIQLFASLLLGIYFNVSMWYKLTNKTMFGIYITALGALITILINFLFIPEFSYLASSWARLICYLIMVIITYFIGQKYYPVHYDLKKIANYFLITLIIFSLFILTSKFHLILKLLTNTILLLIFLFFVLKLENRIKYFKKYVPSIEK